MPDFAPSCVWGRKRLGLASACGDSRESVGKPGSRTKDDGTVGGPGATARVQRFAQNDGRTTGQGRLLQLAGGEKADPLAVGREERPGRAFGARDRRVIEAVQTTQMKRRTTLT